jgi:response regulator of citrate/malate metabolism
MIQVLVVEDDPVAAEAHETYVGRVPGFEVAGVAHTGRDAMRILSERPVDLVLLDLHLPDGNGLDITRALHAGGGRADVIVVTSARDLPTVRAAVSQGVVQYLLKPFTFTSLRQKLERYAQFREQLAGTGEAAGQGEVDRALASLRGVDTGSLPTGLSQETLESVERALRAADRGLAASEVAEQCGMSRVTARRYLEHLTESGVLRREPRYGGPGRPQVEYRWTRPRS